MDQNPYDYLMDGGVTPHALSTAMGAIGYELMVSAENMQEWASCWSAGKSERGRQLFTFMLRIRRRCFITQSVDTIGAEIERLFGRTVPGPVFRPQDFIPAERLCRRFANGSPRESDLQDVVDHHNMKRAAGSDARSDALSWRDRTVTSRTLSEFLVEHPNELRGLVPRYVQLCLRRPATAAEVRTVEDNLDRCPALRAGIRASSYIGWRIATGKPKQSGLPRNLWVNLAAYGFESGGRRGGRPHRRPLLARLDSDRADRSLRSRGG